MKEIKLIVFDMAGTVVNEDNVVYKTVQKAINKAGYSVSLDDVLKEGAGKEKHQAIKDILKKISKSDPRSIKVSSEDIFKDFKFMLDEAYYDLKVSPFQGLTQMMADLKSKGIKVALNTGYNREIANLLLKKMDWHQGIHYDTLVTADDVVNGRPAPDMIQRAMKNLNVANPNQVVKVGDSIIDVEEGKNAACGYTIAVTTGAQTYEQLKDASPDFIMDDLTKLIEMIN